MLDSQVVDQIGRHWGWVALRGVVAILFGLMAMFMPAITLSALVLVWGAFALADGVLALIAGIRIRDQGRPLWFLGLSGLVSILFGAMLVMQPGAGALALVWVIGIYAVFFGILLLVFSLRLKQHRAP